MDSCIFCKVVKGAAPSWKIYENEDVYAFLDINPATKYHTLVIPKQHYTDIFEIPERELKEVIAVVRTLAHLYKEKLGMKHLQILSNTGAEAQQTVFHLHFHIIPRKKGDGQNWHWKTHREWRNEFDEMLSQLR